MDLLILKHLTPMKSYRRWSGRLLSAASRLHGSSALYCASLLQRSFRVRPAAPQGPPWALTGAPGGQAPSLDSCSASLRRRKKGQHLLGTVPKGGGRSPRILAAPRRQVPSLSLFTYRSPQGRDHQVSHLQGGVLGPCARVREAGGCLAGGRLQGPEQGGRWNPRPPTPHPPPLPSTECSRADAGGKTRATRQKARK